MALQPHARLCGEHHLAVFYTISPVLKIMIFVLTHVIFSRCAFYRGRVARLSTHALLVGLISRTPRAHSKVSPDSDSDNTLR